MHQLDCPVQPDLPHRISSLVKEIFIARGWLRKKVYDGCAEQYQVTPKGARFLLHDDGRFGKEVVL